LCTVASSTKYVSVNSQVKPCRSTLKYDEQPYLLINVDLMPEIITAHVIKLSLFSKEGKTAATKLFLNAPMEQSLKG